MARLSLDQIHDLSLRALVGSGTTASQASPVADSMRDAEAEGLPNVGLSYLTIYCEHLRCGKINGHADPQVEQRGPAAIMVDADHGFAHGAFVAAEPAFVHLVRTGGVGALLISRSYSAGVVGWFNDRLARAGLVNLAFANSSALMPPWGGDRALFGTNPLGFGSPVPDASPVVVDMSTSTTAYVNVKSAAEAGGSIPDGWALDSHGRPTTDPVEAMAGMMAPLGGAKGYGLALMVDVLGGALTGSHLSHESSSFGGNEGGPPSVGQLFVAFAPAALGITTFDSSVRRLADAVHEQPGARLPGERRHLARRVAERDGVDVSDALIAQLEAYAH